MSKKVTIERILRDDNDDSGQTIREWCVEAADGHILIKDRRDSGFILLRGEDIALFTQDLEAIRESLSPNSNQKKEGAA